MNEQGVADAVKEWTGEVLPELDSVFAYMTAQHGTLPDAMIDVANKRLSLSAAEFPFSELQQRLLRVFTVTVNIMVETGGEAGDADMQETQQLRDFGARLEDSLLSDATLGERVFMASPLIEFDYSLPFVQYEDGTRGRQMQVNMAVGELAEQEDAFSG